MAVNAGAIHGVALAHTGTSASSRTQDVSKQFFFFKLVEFKYNFNLMVSIEAKQKVSKPNLLLRYAEYVTCKIKVKEK